MPLARLLATSRSSLLAAWLQEISQSDSTRTHVDIAALRDSATRLLELVTTALREEDGLTLASDAWQPVRDYLDELSAARVREHWTPTQTATFVLSLKRPVFELLRKEHVDDAQALADDTWAATELFDAMGLHTVAAYQRTRDEVIRRQQEDMLELSTPVVKLWDGILALPMIGTLDSARTQVVMESLLKHIVDTGSQITILDITGVPTVDTLVAQHLIKTVTAIRLMGGDCIISGVRPQIAQTIVHLGIDLSGITTKATLADALALALRRSGQMVVSAPVPVVA